MNGVLLVILIIIGCEALATFIFWLLARINKKGHVNNKINIGSVVKGMLERAFVTFSMVNGITQSLTLFAALKIATRIKDEENKISNDYYLLGNLLSITLAIIYSQLIIKYIG
ncbi:hypothetical protein [Fulvivirga ligni]|uniref:hypothetical protein n=1 Tax=Fulvivirga ligni TaxID=2904246 RepID=UPI001F4021F2|nr:hypothetical protein [Fulvivirga ligni]UII19066.1 hypothetical protein LVD16_14575 [Fulvivirga ligni]